MPIIVKLTEKPRNKEVYLDSRGGFFFVPHSPGRRVRRALNFKSANNENNTHRGII